MEDTAKDADGAGAVQGLRASLDLSMTGSEDKRRVARDTDPDTVTEADADADADANVRITDVSQHRDSVVLEPAGISIACVQGRARSDDNGRASEDDEGHDRVITSGRGFRLAAKLESDVFERDTVEFAAVEFLCMEGDREVELVVERRGDGKEALELAYNTIDVNVGAECYVPSSGTLKLAENQFQTSFTIPIQDNPQWNVESLLDVELMVTHGSADLGDLYKARVVILNDDVFPQGVDDFDGWKLTRGFIVHNYNYLQRETHLGLIFKMAPGLCFLFQKLITSYVLNDVLIDKDSASLLGACGLFLLTFAVGLVADREYTKLKLDGKAALALRTAMMSTMVQFTPAAEEAFDTGRVLKIADEQTAFAIRKSWTAIFVLFEKVIQLLIMCAFVIYVAGRERLWFLVAVPVMIIVADGLLLSITMPLGSSLSYQAMLADDRWCSFMIQISNLRHLITTYRRGHIVTAEFATVASEHIKADWTATMYSTDVGWLANSIPNVIASVLLFVAGQAYFDGRLGLGFFVTLIDTTNSFGAILGSIFSLVFDICKGLASVQKIADLLNCETRRLVLLRGRQRRNKLIAKFVREGGAWDPDAILLHEVDYAHKSSSKSQVKRLTIPSLSAHIDGGQVIVLTCGGSGSTGKRTLLRLLARHFIPRKGFIYYPERWRVRYLDAKPLFLKGTLMTNLRFGNFINHTDEEVWALCRRVGLRESLIGHADLEVGYNGEKLSTTDQALLTIVRALLSSVDLILCSNLLDVLSEERAVYLTKFFKEIVHCRAVPCLKTENRKLGAHRKRKTVIISSKYGSVEALAHFNLSLSDNEAENRKFKRVSVVARSLNIAPEEVATVLSEESESNQALHVQSGLSTPNPLTLAQLNALSSYGSYTDLETGGGGGALAPGEDETPVDGDGTL